MDPGLQELLAEGKPDDEIALIVRLRDPSRSPAGLHVVSRFGTIVTGRALRGSVPAIWADATVRSVKAPQRLVPDVELFDDFDEAALPEGVDDQRRPEGIPETGRGVVLGIADWGCDFAHPDFRREDNRTRLLALWDQRPAVGGFNAPFGYGRIWTSDRIDDALCQPDPYGSLDYHPADFDAGLGAHGTHTLSIAAGNGRAGGPSGLAPEADVVFVSLDKPAGPISTPLGQSHQLLEALDFIFRMAGDRPCAVNMSLGRHAGEHSGHSLVEMAMDELLVASPGRAIVQSCGNYYERRTHASWQLRPGDVQTFSIEVDAADRTTNELDIWYPGRDRLTIELSTASGQARRAVALGQRASIAIDGVELARIRHRQSDPQTGDNECTIYLEPDKDVHDWQVTLRADDVVDGRVHAWIERDSGCRACQSRFPEDVADRRGTLGSIASGFRTIAVGAYGAHWDDRRLGPFSSAGTTRDGRQKPEVVAPGLMVLGARSAGRRGAGGSYARQSGTSMAAPHVTGTVALMLEAADRLLPIEEIRLALLAACTPPTADADPRRLGSGYLNVRAAVEAARPGAPLRERHAPVFPADTEDDRTLASPETDAMDGSASPTPESDADEAPLIPGFVPFASLIGGPAPGPCPDVEVPPDTRPRVLARGAVHAAVRIAQRQLNAVHLSEVAMGGHGLDGAPLRDDCVFGPHTFDAVLSFQRLAFPGLPAEQDGRIGPHTWAALDRYPASAPTGVLPSLGGGPLALGVDPGVLGALLSPPTGGPSSPPTGGPAVIDPDLDHRILSVMELLVYRYGYPVNGSAGLVGNLIAESGVLPDRIEGSRADTPLRSAGFDGRTVDFLPDQVMNRNAAARTGPRLPGIGLAQWTSTGRRSGLFRHPVGATVLGPAILFDLAAQVDYLVSELGSSFRGVDAMLRRPNVTVDDAADEVVYRFEVPGAILDGSGHLRSRDHEAVRAVFRERRTAAARALRVYRSAHPGESR